MMHANSPSELANIHSKSEPATETNFTLRCDALQGEYSFSEDGAAPWQDFVELRAALAHIATLVDKPIAVSVCNEQGQNFLTIDVTPTDY